VTKGLLMGDPNDVLRTHLLFVPGELVRTDNKPVLKFPANCLYKESIEYALKQIEKVKL
jgi:hypothetical protein